MTTAFTVAAGIAACSVLVALTFRRPAPVPAHVSTTAPPVAVGNRQG
jgi:hypothetical protein